MNAEAALELVAIAARYAMLALRIKEDATPFLALVVKWSTGTIAFDPADLVAMHTQAQPLFDKLNDTSRDRA